ncbi:hypothetical protein COX08_04495 [Candidatus Beckwithbacteria bacterium CG23_combo_of_CG06-09_8_20_14_all_34_8]|uniref:Uncharacterized protein n=2 Tax=Microgenomates group TaxID=1794810 RepID=A0A2H0B589_9BACT|nr:MAG: hypothetical protein COX08_04495 [Candidatus Beckwithbacteria bacterium CG23_combo_of_CG06-09_8_20_14_all_34_8]PIY72025.1 MAG: hypothetical protein COY87_03100 [Candidatus Roizmanbacteria bacterium CG_4_10_14_0_8_um_filter_33_9]
MFSISNNYLIKVILFLILSSIDPFIIITAGIFTAMALHNLKSNMKLSLEMISQIKSKVF